MKKNGYNLKLYVGIIILILSPVLAQGHTLFNADTFVSGTVVDATTNETLPGVNIKVKNRVIGTSTDPNGHFELKINEDAPVTLIFSSVGYKTREVEISLNEQTDLTISMEQQVLLGNEIVVSASRVQ